MKWRGCPADRLGPRRSPQDPKDAGWSGIEHTASAKTDKIYISIVIIEHYITEPDPHRIARTPASEPTGNKRVCHLTSTRFQASLRAMTQVNCKPNTTVPPPQHFIKKQKTEACTVVICEASENRAESRALELGSFRRVNSLPWSKGRDSAQEQIATARDLVVVSRAPIAPEEFGDSGAQSADISKRLSAAQAEWDMYAGILLPP